MTARDKREFQGISDAELSVLRVLWDGGPGTPSTLQERLAEDGNDWAYTTVQTLLHRLHRKGHVDRRKEGVTQIYSALASRDELLHEHMEDLARRMCDGAASPLLMSLVRGGSISKADIARFRRVLDEAEAGDKRKKAAAPKKKGPRR